MYPYEDVLHIYGNDCVAEKSFALEGLLYQVLDKV